MAPMVRYNGGMGNLLDSLGVLVVQYPSWSHIIIAAGILLQGEVTLLVAISLILGRHLGWGEFLLTALTALVVVESLIYCIGRMVRRSRFGWRLDRRIRDNRRIQLYTHYLHRNASKLLILARFLLGANLAVLVLAGWSEMRPGKFFKAYLSGVLLWFASMSIISYAFLSGLFALRTTNLFQKIEFGVVILLIVIFTGEYLLKKMLGKAAAIEHAAERIGKTVDHVIKNPGP